MRWFRQLGILCLIGLPAGLAAQTAAEAPLSVIDWLDKPINGNRLEKAITTALRDNGKQSRILHIEDDPDIVHIVNALLQDMATVEVAGDLRTARQKLQQDYDLVILDISLPDGSGTTLLPELSRRESPTPVVVFSAAEIDEKASQEVAASFVKSKTSARQLIETIESMLQCNKKK